MQVSHSKKWKSQKAQKEKDKKQLTQYQQRLKEIDNLIQHIYEDNVSGKITDEMFSNFSTNYTNEQKDLKENHPASRNSAVRVLVKKPWFCLTH